MEADLQPEIDIMSMSRDDGSKLSNRSKEDPIKSKEESRDNDEYGYGPIWLERFAGRVQPWWPAKHNARSRQRAY
jgi:hypothetical protein